MKVLPVNSRKVATAGRLDCWYFLSAGNASLTALDKAKDSGLSFATIGGKGGLGMLWAPKRFKRAYQFVEKRLNQRS